MLRQLFVATILAVSALASPIATSKPAQLDERDIDTRNDLYDLDCRAVTVIFARGTIEPGNVGLLAGPPLFYHLGELIGDDQLAVQGVDYPATIGGYLEGGDPDGASKLAQIARDAASKCPDTKLVLSGYSQGAQVVHLGAAQLEDDVTNRVSSVVLFGDPYEGQPIPDIDTAKVDTICLAGDFICDGLPIVGPPHLIYAFTAQQAAQFVADRL